MVAAEHSSYPLPVALLIVTPRRGIIRPQGCAPPCGTAGRPYSLPRYLASPLPLRPLMVPIIILCHGISVHSITSPLSLGPPMTST